MHNTLNTVLDFAKITTSVVADVVDGLDKLVSEYASSSSSSHRNMESCEAGEYLSLFPSLCQHPAQYMINSYVLELSRYLRTAQAVTPSCTSRATPY